MKMNNQEIERFEHHVGDMYNILINISTELNTIKVTQNNLETRDNLETFRILELIKSENLLNLNLKKYHNWKNMDTQSNMEAKDNIYAEVMTKRRDDILA